MKTAAIPNSVAVTATPAAGIEVSFDAAVGGVVRVYSHVPCAELRHAATREHDSRSTRRDADSDDFADVDVCSPWEVKGCTIVQMSTVSCGMRHTVRTRIECADTTPVSRADLNTTNSDDLLDAVVVITPRLKISDSGTQWCPIAVAIKCAGGSSIFANSNNNNNETRLTFDILAMVQGKLLRVESVFGAFSSTSTVGRSTIAAVAGGGGAAAAFGDGDMDCDGRATSTDNDSRCLVCWEDTTRLLLLPCRHVCVCASCLPQLDRKCPMCRQAIVKAILPEGESHTVHTWSGAESI